VHPGKRIALAVLLLPVAELVAFLVVAWAIGFLAAIGLAVLTSLAGAAVLRYAGASQIARLRTAVNDNGVAGFQASGGGLLVVLAGLLLLIPGFITDALGALLLLGPIRTWLNATVGRAARRGNRRTRTDEVIDLDRDDWRQLPDTDLPPPTQPPRDR
jgi:UPF0716 protein FxsA